jgi:hypothetical protein
MDDNSRRPVIQWRSFILTSVVLLLMAWVFIWNGLNQPGSGAPVNRYPGPFPRLGPAFLCATTPLYEYGIGTPDNPTPPWMNKKPALVAAAGTEVYKVVVFGKNGLWPGQTRVRLRTGGGLYFVWNNQLSDSCSPSQTK